MRVSTAKEKILSYESYLVETNVLFRLVQKTSPSHAAARKAALALRKQGQEMYVIQNLIEFWAVATRPVAHNGLGLTTAQAVWELRKLKRFFRLQPDTPTISQSGRNLLLHIRYQGSRCCPGLRLISSCCRLTKW